MPALYTLSRVYVCSSKGRRVLVVDFAAGPSYKIYEKPTLLGMTFINLTFSTRLLQFFAILLTLLLLTFFSSSSETWYETSDLRSSS